MVGILDRSVRFLLFLVFALIITIIALPTFMEYLIPKTRGYKKGAAWDFQHGYGFIGYSSPWGTYKTFLKMGLDAYKDRPQKSYQIPMLAWVENEVARNPCRCFIYKAKA
mgnify:CR=1 FL=1